MNQFPPVTLVTTILARSRNIDGEKNNATAPIAVRTSGITMIVGASFK